MKRDQIKSFLEALKKNNSDDEQIKAINEIESFLDEKRYGLVWEEHEEQVDVMMRDNIPVFTEDESKKIISDPDKPMNFLLEGDNLHSLYLLEKTHKGLIDVIYIDPPYNTGNKDFLYDDTFINKDDMYRHSKWLSFMEKRLRIAKNLLRTDGIIFVSIDENEQANLELLMDAVFDNDNKVGEFIWKGRSGKGGTNSQIAFQHEYIKVYAKNISVVNFYQINSVSEKAKTENLRQWGDNSPFRRNRPTMFYPILIKDEEYGLPTDEELLRIFKREHGSFDDDYLNDLINQYESSGYKVVLPLREDSEDGYGRWRQGIPGIKNLISSHLLTHSVDKNGDYTIKKIIPSGKESSTALDSILDKKGTSSDGTKEIKRMFGKKVFDTTKPIDLIKYLIFLGTFNKPQSVVLDFFAGSGTTGEAVIELNRDNSWDRKFILCTNNEGDIAKQVTYPRLSMISNGYIVHEKAKEIIYEENLTPAKLKKMDSILSTFESRKAEEAESFDNISLLLKEHVLSLVGEKSKKSFISPRSFNLKYFATAFVAKSANENFSLTDELLNHIQEMTELKYGVDLATNARITLVLDEDELDDFFEKENIEGTTLLHPSFVLPRGQQSAKAESLNITLIRIPDYYFASELREAGEL